MAPTIMSRNIPSNFLVAVLFATSIVVQVVHAEWSLYTTDLEANTFTNSSLNGWSYGSISSCSLDTSPPSLITGNNTTKTFSPLPPHFKVRVSFELFLIGKTKITFTHEEKDQYINRK